MAHETQTITLSALTTADTVDYDALPESTRIVLQQKLAAMIEREAALVFGDPAVNVPSILYMDASGRFRSEPVDVYDTPRCSCRVVHTCGFVCS